MEKKIPPGPHQTLSSSRTSSSADDGSELAAVFGSLRPAAQVFTPPASSAGGSRGSGFPVQTRSVVKYSFEDSDNDLVERARNDLAQQSQLMMHGKVLRLVEQVNELLEERSTAQEKADANERTIEELRQQVASLKTQMNTHHVSIQSNKQLLSERGREAHQVSTRVEQVHKAMMQQNKQQSERLGDIEALARKTEHQVNNHFGQLKEEDLRISEIEEDVAILKRKKIQPTTTKSAGNTLSASNSASGAISAEVKALQASQVQTNTYLKQVGQKLVDHQNTIATSDVVLNCMRARLEGLHAVMSRICGQQEESGGLRMDQRDVAFVHLQTQISQLEKQIRETATGNPDGSMPQLNNSGTAATDDLRGKMNAVHAKISQIEQQLKADRIRQKNHDEIALASKFRLEELFKQLTKEMLGECTDEEIVFDVDADQAFVLRQRVLERLSVDDMVQVQFERLKVLPM